MVKARKYVVEKYFDGIPKISDYRIVEYELPSLRNGEILLKAEWISIDPYIRAYNRMNKVPYDQFSFQIGIVQESLDPNYPVGTRVVTHKGWCDYTIVSDKKAPVKDIPNDILYKLQDLKGLSPSLGIGALGMPGATAYLAFLEICKPKKGETVVVTGAAGAVGSIVGQIAKIKGCKVIGFAGSDNKVNWLEKELGFDKALNYKTVDVQTALKSAAPNGIDCYFDNVGGEISSTIMAQMNKKGRVAVCGSISSYNADPSQMPKATIIQLPVILNELKIEGFIIWEWFDRWFEAFDQLTAWIRNGQLKTPEHVTDGFDNLFEAFIGMMSGDNFGKAVVKV
ncbi:prostaglandin reductase 1-like [Vanessa atalanta]|uniref:prostaglandin reductase 1-like n=1 Tax=Vanessa atalanta TaxID=42275 RepID=UPI001FCD10AB|nr:prostaglandin reductase 1-like [Vanessa atalanta]